jgi:thymidylate synthase (FAD)
MENVTLIAITPDAEAVVESSGRICYDSEVGSSKDFVRRLVKSGHESVIEHSSATFEIECSRACSHQIIRHRLASYSQRSQRYVREAEPEYVIPPSISQKGEALSAFEEAMASAWAVYADLLEMGVRPQDARFVLPNACKTRIRVTMNFRSWRHFIKERGVNPAAQWEIRDIALQILTILSREAPSCFSDLLEGAD